MNLPCPLSSGELDLLACWLPSANESELNRLYQLLTGQSEWPLWMPNPGPQATAYYNLDADIIGYGGAAGGGKSDLLLGFALTQHRRSIIFRRESTQGRALIDRAREIVGKQGSLNLSTGVWPPTGVRLSAIGVDVARGGRAQTVLARRYGNWFAALEKHPGRTTPDGQAVAAVVAQALQEHSGALVCIDALGVGSSPTDLLRMAVRGCRLFPIMSADPIQATDRAGVLRFVNVRAFAYWSLRDLLDPGWSG